MSEKFNLKWNDFQSNVSRTFSLLRNEDEFLDVTLVSEDQKMMSAHKLVLSSCSPYFKQILTQNKHSHPLLCLDGVSSGELQSVLDYIYQGEVQVYPEQLDRFLEVAQKFQLDGLNNVDTKEEPTQHQNLSNEPEYETRVESKRKLQKIKPITAKDTEIVVMEDNADISVIDAKIEEYIVKNNEGTYSCGLCDKTVKLKGDIKKHIETHMEGLSFPCQSCDKTFRSRNSFHTHISRFHQNLQ